MIRVLVVDDHAVVRTGLAALIATTADIRLAGEAQDAREALEQADRLRPDVIVMDLSMPGLAAHVAIERLAASDPPLGQVLVLTSFDDEDDILAALRAGARGFLLKHTEPRTLLDGIRQVAAGWSPLDPRAGRALLTTMAPLAGTTLTGREREVLVLLGDGQPNRTIARRLGISERTVKAHLTSIYRRIGVSDRTRAALWVHRYLRAAE
jgi:DNA-binding NarL/FixJ family response regulator